MGFSRRGGTPPPRRGDPACLVCRTRPGGGAYGPCFHHRVRRPVGGPVVCGGRSRDRDHDGLSDRYEVKRSHTNPRKADTDGDALRDRFEVRRSHTNPRKKDTDGDGLTDGYEVKRSNTSALRQDTDRDGAADGMELLVGTDPRERARRRASSPRRSPPPPTPDLLPPETQSAGPVRHRHHGGASFTFLVGDGLDVQCRLDTGSMGELLLAQAAPGWRAARTRSTCAPPTPPATPTRHPPPAPGPWPCRRRTRPRPTPRSPGVPPARPRAVSQLRVQRVGGRHDLRVPPRRRNLGDAPLRRTTPGSPTARTPSRARHRRRPQHRHFTATRMWTVSARARRPDGELHLVAAEPAEPARDSPFTSTGTCRPRRARISGGTARPATTRSGPARPRAGPPNRLARRRSCCASPTRSAGSPRRPTPSPCRARPRRPRRGRGRRGVPDNSDQCPGTPAGTPVDSTGCPDEPAAHAARRVSGRVEHGCAGGDELSVLTPDLARSPRPGR